MQLKTVGKVVCPDGIIKYMVDGGRCSGDMDTSLGNVLVMCGMLYCYLYKHRLLKKVTLVDDGDDFQIICERATAAKLTGFEAFARDCGFEVEMTKLVDELERVVFCQSQPVFDGRVWLMVRDPRKCMDKDSTCASPVNSVHHFEQWRSAVGKCGLRATGGIPVLGMFYHNMITTRCRRVPQDLLQSGFYLWSRDMHRTHTEPTDEARASFHRAFGITPDQQLVMEQLISERKPPRVILPAGERYVGILGRLLGHFGEMRPQNLVHHCDPRFTRLATTINVVRKTPKASQAGCGSPKAPGQAQC